MRQKPREVLKSSQLAGISAHMVSNRAAKMRFWLPCSVVVLLLSCGLIFFRLGHYPLWVDEADTALFARGIARTGDTSAVIDHNVYVYQMGALLKNLHGRYQPPVPYYLAAPFVGASGTGSLWPRIPFAVCGLLSVMIILYGMHRSRLTTATWLVFSIGLVCNVSFFLFCRQCRYYSLSMLLSLVIAYLYLNWKSGRWRMAAIVLASILLLGTNELQYAALYAVLGCDYLLFGRRERRLAFRQWFFLLVPQILAGAIILWIYNPLGMTVVIAPPPTILVDRLLTIWRNLRDLNNCEFCAGIIMLIGVPVFCFTRNTWLLRGLMAIACYTVAAAIVGPQPSCVIVGADVRFLAPLIPLCIGVSTMVIVTLTKGRWYCALPLAVAAFGFNAINQPFYPRDWTSRPVEFVRELSNPQTTSIDVTAKWIDDHVGPGQSIWVSPMIFEPSLMYHAPQPTYAWHLLYPPKKQFETLPTVHFISRCPLPDYFIVFGDHRKRVEKLIAEMKERGVDYQLAEILDIYWLDLTRPEIFLRSFRPIEDFDRQTDAVYVYRHVTRF
jgi:hypothetical protein